MAELMRVAALTGYFSTMSDFGINPRPLLKQVGLAPELLIDPEQLIPAVPAIRLLELSAQVTGCVTLGLRMAERRALANLGAASLLISHQPNLRLALTTLAEFRARINSTLVLNFEETDGEVILREDFSLSRPEPSRQASNLALAVIALLCVRLLSEDWSPRAVCFSHRPPPPEELPIFLRLFRCRPQFDCEFNAVVVASSDMDRANTSADGQLASHARQLLEAVLSPGERSAAEEVEQLISLLLPTGRATVQTCAASLGVTVRTLQRKLDAEGQSFSDLLNRVRMQLATQYLSNQRMRVTDVADMLGYGSIGAFTRWHAQTFGLSPMQWRRAQRLQG